MSLRSLEAVILREARSVFKNSKLRQKDILEWTTGSAKREPGEVVVRLPETGVEVAILKEHDKRK